MKVKVLKAYRDKETKSILMPGQEIEVTQKRFGELTEPFVFVEKIKDKPEDKPEDKPVKNATKK